MPLLFFADKERCITINNEFNKNNAASVIVVDAPDVSFEPDDNAGDLLLRFYRALGWNGEDNLDPCKIRTTEEVFNRLLNQMSERCADMVSVGMFMVNIGPGTENYIPQGKVYLLEGWVTPAPEKGESADAA